MIKPDQDEVREQLTEYFRQVKDDNRREKFEKLEERRRRGLIHKPKWEIS